MAASGWFRVRRGVHSVVGREEVFAVETSEGAAADDAKYGIIRCVHGRCNRSDESNSECKFTVRSHRCVKVWASFDHEFSWFGPFTEQSDFIREKTFVIGGDALPAATR